jgi:hypothetical protein
MIQPLIGKAILPLVGGTPSVWILTMLFFQFLLLLGYGYAAVTSARLSVKNQFYFHLALNLLAITIFMPLDIKTRFLSDIIHSEFNILIVLSYSVGLPFFVLSANSSLLQRWYHARYQKTPYHLFSISNLGSMTGLLSYPLLIEWLLPLHLQLIAWSFSFVVLLILIFFAVSSSSQKTSDRTISLGKNMDYSQCFKTVFYGFIPSSMFLGLTLHITTDIAAFPLIWVIPLSIYLLTFIISFSNKSKRITSLAQILHPYAFAAIILFLSLPNIIDNVLTILVIHLILFFIIAQSCHGQAAKEKPAPEYLTSYYFWLSVGGVLGGLFNALSPHLFNDIYEYIIVTTISIFALPTKGKIGLNRISNKMLAPTFALFAIIIIFILHTDTNQSDLGYRKIIESKRNFFGVSKIMKDDKQTIFMHGTTLHGLQKINSNQLSITSYYYPIQELITDFPKAFFSKPFAVIGLGVGTLACVGQKGQEVDFFEIDDLVINIAQNDNYFTYLSKCPAKSNVFKGDGRLEISKQPDHKYNLLVADAFSSDSVPMHMLSLEAVKIMKNKITSDVGILAFNISNRYLDLSEVLAKIATELNMSSYLIQYRSNSEDKFEAVTNSDWLIMCFENSQCQRTLENMNYKKVSPSKTTPLWTDNYSQALGTLKILKSKENS